MDINFSFIEKVLREDNRKEAGQLYLINESIIHTSKSTKFDKKTGKAYSKEEILTEDQKNSILNNLSAYGKGFEEKKGEGVSGDDTIKIYRSLFNASFTYEDFFFDYDTFNNYERLISGFNRLTKGLKEYKITKDEDLFNELSDLEFTLSFESVTYIFRLNALLDTIAPIKFYIDFLTKRKNNLKRKVSKKLLADLKSIGINSRLLTDNSKLDRGNIELSEVNSKFRATAKIEFDSLIDQIFTKESSLPASRKTNTYRQSAALYDQMLKSPKPVDGQMKLFDTYGGVKDNEFEDVQFSRAITGLGLSAAEGKLVNALSKMLDIKSQTKNPKENNYYLGNTNKINTVQDDFEVKHEGKNSIEKKITRAYSELTFTYYELAQVFTRKDVPPGKDIENVVSIANNFAEKSFFIKESYKYRERDGTIVTQSLKKKRKMIFIDEASQTRNKDGKIDIEKEQVITLDPLFNYEIGKRFITRSDDLDERIELAYGSKKISREVEQLTKYLLRSKSAKNLKPQITLDKLYWQISAINMQASRKARAKKNTQKAIDTLVKAELLLSYKITDAKTGEKKTIFHINKDAEKKVRT